MLPLVKCTPMPCINAFSPARHSGHANEIPRDVFCLMRRVATFSASANTVQKCIYHQCVTGRAFISLFPAHVVAAHHSDYHDAIHDIAGAR